MKRKQNANALAMLLGLGAVLCTGGYLFWQSAQDERHGVFGTPGEPGEAYPVDVRNALRDTTIISGKHDCRDCIRLVPVATLGHVADATSPFFASHVIRVANRWFVLAPLWGHPGFAVYDSVGRFRLLYGRSGDGPGEFRRIQRVAKGPDETVYALDRGRITALVLRDSTFEVDTVVTLSARALTEFAITRDGEILITGPQRQGLDMGPPVHVVGADGGIVRSFGQSTGPARGDKPWSAERLVAAGTSGKVVVAPLNRYEIEVYEPTGRAYLIKRRVSWFPDWSDWPEGTRRPLVGALWISPDDRLWVTLSLPTTARAEGGRGLPTASMIHGRSDTIIEVFDLRKRRLLASTRLDAVMSVTNDGHFVSPTDNASGHMSTRVWRAVISLPGTALAERRLPREG